MFGILSKLQQKKMLLYRPLLYAIGPACLWLLIKRTLSLSYVFVAGVVVADVLERTTVMLERARWRASVQPFLCFLRLGSRRRHVCCWGRHAGTVGQDRIFGATVTTSMSCFFFLRESFHRTATSIGNTRHRHAVWILLLWTRDWSCYWDLWIHHHKRFTWSLRARFALI